MSRENKSDHDIDIDSLNLDELDISDLNFNDEFDTELEQLDFIPEHQQQIIDKLIHLSRFGNLLTLVTGQNGSGKTALIEEFIEQLDDSQICHVKAQPLVSIDQLFQQVIEAFAGEKTFTGIPLTAKQYEDWAEQLATSTNNRLLIIDDAEMLSSSVLHELCQLAAIQQEKETPHIHIILFGNYDLTSTIEQAAQGVLAEEGIYIIDIPELSEQDASQWLTICLEQEDKLALSEQQFQRLLVEGEGNFSRLAMLAAEVDVEDDFDSTPEVFEEHDDKQISLVGYWFAGLTFLVLFVIGIFIYQKEITAWLGLTSEPEPIVAISDQSQDEALVTQQTESQQVDSKQSEPEQAIAKPSVGAVEAADASSEQLSIEADVQPVKPPVEQEKQEPVKNLEQAQMQAIESETQAQDSEASQKEELTELQRQTAIASESKYTQDEQFLLAQPDSNYAVQIIGLTSEQSIKNYIALFPDLELRYYRTLLKGKPWHIVVLGSYPTKEQANQVRNSLPTELAKNKPWLKSYQKIKQDIELQ